MKVIVVGGNAAGMSFAAKYKRNNPNHEIIVFEKRVYVSFGSCGLPYFVGGFFDVVDVDVDVVVDVVDVDVVDVVDVDVVVVDVVVDSFAVQIYN